MRFEISDFRFQIDGGGPGDHGGSPLMPAKGRGTVPARIQAFAGLMAALLFGFTLAFADDPHAQKKDACAGCHEKEWNEYRGSMHQKGDVTCEDCHGKASGPIESKTEKHEEGSQLPADHKAYLVYCGRCHEAEVTAFKKGPHGKQVSTGVMKGCLDCHVSHHTEHIVHAGITAKCQDCHKADSDSGLAALKEGESIQGRFVSLQSLLDGLQARMEEKRTYRWEFREQEESLLGSRAVFKDALPQQHGVRSKGIEEGARTIEEAAACVQGELAERIRAQEGRRRWLAPVLILTTLNALLVWLTWRRARRA